MAFTVSKQTGTWLLIFTIVGAVLIGIQVVRVNRPKPVEDVVEKRTYATEGRVFTGDVEVQANTYYAHKIDLNRRMKLSGAFRTTSLKSTIVVVVVRESDFETWKAGGEVTPVTKTNLVPGGKITPMLEPGVYYLILDNRSGDEPRLVSNDFSLE